MSHPYATAAAAAAAPSLSAAPAAPVKDAPNSSLRGASVPPSPPPVLSTTASSPSPTPATPPAARINDAAHGGSSGSAAADSRGLPSEPDGANHSRRSFSRSDTVVSHTDNVSSSSYSSPTTSDFSSRSASRATSSSSSSTSRSMPASHRSASVCSVDSGRDEVKSDHRLHHRHRHEHLRRPHRLHDDTNRSLAGHGSGNNRLHRVDTTDEPEGYLAGSDTSGRHLCGRVQTSGLTHFTHVLAAGARGTAQPHPLQRNGSHSGGFSSMNTSSNAEDTHTQLVQQQQRWWGATSTEGVAMPTKPSASSTSPGHPYQAPYLSDGNDAPISFSPSPVRKTSTNDNESGNVAAANVANATPMTEFSASSTMPNPHTQRPHSALATVSRLKAAATPPTTSTPLPPTHPRRSASAKSRTSVSPSGSGSVRRASLPSQSQISGGGSGAIRPSQTIFARNSSGCSPPPCTASGGDAPAHPPTPRGTHSANSTPTSQAALRRSSSFTSGVLPPAGSWVADGEGGHPYLVSAAPPSSGLGTSMSPLHGTRAMPLGERVHERTSSVASSVHSASSSARPSVPLPPSHVGPASNLMAAVWVDLSVSQPGSRCATPVSANNNASDAQQQQQHRRRRTTPRRGSEPPSPATSTLAASVVSSLDGGGYASSSAAAAALASVRMHYVTVGTQTDQIVDNAADPDSAASDSAQDEARTLPTSSLAVSTEGTHTPEKMVGSLEEERRGDALRFKSTTAILLPATAASVSSTSAEVSPRSLRVSTADPGFDETPLLDACVASKLGGPLHVSPSHSCGRPATTEVPAITAANVTESTAASSSATGKESACRVNVPPPPPPPPTLPSSAAFSQEMGKASIKAAQVDAPASPVGLIVSPVTPELPTLQCTGTPPPSANSQAADDVSGTAGKPPAAAVAQTARASPLASLPAGEPPTHLSAAPRAAMEEAGRVDDVTRSHGHAGAGSRHAPPSPPPPAAHTDEVERLRIELAQMRTQYAHVLHQLNVMQHSGHNAAGAAPAAASTVGQPALSRMDDTEDVSAVSRSPSAASPTSSSSLSASLTDESGASPSVAPTMAPTTSSDADAAATLRHVREALERTRQRTNT